MDREGGNKEKLRKCRKWISLHFLILSPFPLHFLILSPFSRSQADAICATLAQNKPEKSKALSPTNNFNIYKHVFISSSSESGSSTASLSTSAPSTSSRVLTISLSTLIRIGLHALSFGRSFFLMFPSSKTSKCTLKKVKTIASVCWLCSSIPFWQDCVQKLQKNEEKKLFPALCWDIKYICWLNTRPSANDGSTSVWGVLDVFKHPILTRLD